MTSSPHLDRASYLKGIALFNHGEFFDAHEVFEDVWRAAPEPERKFLQGLIQLAVGFHHFSTGNCLGARSLLERGSRNLAAYSDPHLGVRLAPLLACVADWCRALDLDSPLPPLPRIQVDD
jgi:predicted metal-dependent hydrolase